MAKASASSTIRPVKIGDRAQLVDLLRTRDDIRPADAEKRALVFEWLAFHNPMANGEPTYFVAEQDGQIVGHLGRMPVDMNDRGRSFRGAFGHDLFVHPEARKKGRALFITSKLYKALEDSVDTFIGLLWTNQINLEIQRFRKYSELRAQRYVYLIDATDLIAERIDSKALVKATGKATRTALHAASSLMRRARSMGRTVEVVNRFDEKADRLFESVRSKLRIGTVRSSKYLNWKYADHPFAKTHLLEARAQNGDMVGLAVVGVMRQLDPPQGVLLDLVVDPDDAQTITALAQATIEYLGQDPSIRILDVLCSDDRVGRTLRTNLFVHRPGTLMLLANIAKYPSQAELLDPTSWFVSYGDSDGYVWIL